MEPELTVVLKEATYERDREFRQRAERFYWDLITWIAEPEEVLKRRALAYKDGAVGFPAIDFSKDENFRKLLVIFAPEKMGTKGGLGHLPSGKTVMIFYNLLGPGDVAHLNTRTSRDVVVHEAIHFLDQLRYKGVTVGSAKKRESGGQAAYFNSPSEWNAFWQEGAASAERMAQNMKNPQGWKGFFGTSLKEFIGKAKHSWDEDFIDTMDEVTKRKFLKRLAEFWDKVIKDKAPKESRVEEIMGIRNLLIEDEQQRMLRASAVDDDYRLPNVHRVIPHDRMVKIPYKGQSEITIYRGVGKDDPARIIRPGDWVSLSKSYAKSHGGGKVLERKVLAMDVSWAGTDENEWFYSPLRKRAAR